MSYKNAFLNAAQKSAAELRLEAGYQDKLPRRQFEQVLKILSAHDFMIGREKMDEGFGEYISVSKYGSACQMLILNECCFCGEVAKNIFDLVDELQENKIRLNKKQSDLQNAKWKKGYNTRSGESLRREERVLFDLNLKIEDITFDIIENKESLKRLSAEVNQKSFEDMMHSFGAWVGRNAPDLVEFIGATLDMSEGRQISLEKQQVVMSLKGR